MAEKKSELYSSLWASCDALRGGMDASQYKDYILTLLFVKYVSDKFAGQDYADIEIPEGGSFADMVKLIGKKDIGEGINKVIPKLAEANGLRGVIDKVSFNDPDKLGKGEEMVEKLSKLIEIFRRPELDFSKNQAEGDDLIGDAYEYLTRKFATESGKSKGQFYTPAEVSRILAKVIGIADEKNPSATIYDPACGSGSLLIRALNEAPIALSGYGQEKDTTTAGLAKMNAVLHGWATATIMSGNTFSDPQYFEEGSDETVLRRFDYIVANPPFSIKNWMDGVKEYGRFDGYGERSPEKNGGYAWLMHILKSLKRTGKAAVILPHGVLFRGNAEGTIRENLIRTGYIKGIIGLPANLFYGTGIPACITKDSKGFLRDGDLIVADTAEDVIVGKSTEVIGIGERKIVSGLHTIPCRPKDAEMFAPGWLGYFINHSTYYDQLVPYITGIKVSSISKSAISGTVIAVPKKEEQTEITAALTDIDTLITNLEKLIAKKRVIKQGAMQELLTGKRRLPGFEGEWNTYRFGDIFVILPNNAFTRAEMSDSGVVKNIHYGDILTKYHEYIFAESNEIPYIASSVDLSRFSDKCFVKSGDIIIADTAEDETVGKALEVIMVSGLMLSGQHTMLCRPQIPFAERFLGYYLNATCYHEQLIPYITGTKVSSISKTSIAQTFLCVPSLQEQATIADILTDMDNEIAKLEENLAKYRLVKQGMMSELLTGRIRLL